MAVGTLTGRLKSRAMQKISALPALVIAVLVSSVAASAYAASGAALFGVPIDFILFALTLLGVALFHHHTLKVALIGLAAITFYKVVFASFHQGAGLAGLMGHLAHEWVILANLLGLLLGFAILAKHFEQSRIPALLPNYLPDDWKGGFVDRKSVV